MAKQQIVLARVDDAYRVVGTARVDLGEQPKTERYDEPKALMWLRAGDAADVTKAQAYARSEGWTVLTYDVSERDPLGCARRDIMKRSANGR